MSHDSRDPDRDPVDFLAEEFADRLRRGEHPSVADYAAAHPDHAEQLRELLPAVAQMEFLKRFRRATGQTTQESLPDRFGDFRIIRELGRGGMGVVFEATQESLERSVALKVLSPHSQFDHLSRERFVREAHAAARLHHTNIVPVFGVGEQDGLPYYVMQLIRGEGLHALVRRWRFRRGSGDGNRETVGALRGTKRATGGRPAAGASRPPVPGPPAPEDGPAFGDWTFVAEVGQQAADALHYAHRQGVLHRDVKPGNLILDPTGRVWVTDFGLAKLVEQKGLTATGDVLGTLQYLPPESLTGDSDARSDVYGLGATLYELLTLEPPFAADNPARLLKLVADTEPVPPRERNPAVPRDLETIVLKAMARDPSRRYSSGRELARDLQAFLDDRPIKARRQSMVGRAWRWCRRNPATAVLTANMVAALVLAGVVGWVGYARTKRALAAEAAQLSAAQKAEADAVQASERLEANLRLSLEAFEKVFDAAGGRPAFVGRGFGFGPGGPGGPGGHGGPGNIAVGIPVVTPTLRPGGFPGEEDRAAVLEVILEFYDKFAERNATNPHLQLEAGRAHRKVGEVQALRGNADRATLSFRRAATLLLELARHEPDDPAVKLELVLTYLGAPLDAFPGYDAILVRMREVARELAPPERPQLPGSVTLKLAWVRDRAGDREAAEREYRAAVQELAPAWDDPGARPQGVVAEQAMARMLLAALLAETKRPAEAKKVLEDSVAEFRVWGERFRPGGPLPTELLTRTYQQLAEVCDRVGDHRGADAARDAVRTLGQGGFGGFGERPGGPKGPKGPKDPPPRKG